MLCGAREALQLGEQRTVLGLGPGLDGAFGERPRLVRDDQVHVEVDGVAEALAARAGAVGAVEREQARLGLVEAQVAALALEALREAEARRLALRRRGLDDDLAGFAVAGLDSVHDAGARVGGDADAVHQHEHRLR